MKPMHHKMQDAIEKETVMATRAKRRFVVIDGRRIGRCEGPCDRWMLASHAYGQPTFHETHCRDCKPKSARRSDAELIADLLRKIRADKAANP